MKKSTSLYISACMVLAVSILVSAYPSKSGTLPNNNKTEVSKDTVVNVVNDVQKVVEQVEVAKKEYKVTATMYNAVESQCDADPLTTAGMYTINPSKASEHKWIAMSRDMISRWGGDFNYGDKVEIKGAGDKDGIYTVADTMNERYKNRIDILETLGTSLYKYENVILQKV